MSLPNKVDDALALITIIIIIVKILTIVVIALAITPPPPNHYHHHCHPHHLLGELALPNKVEDGVASINSSRGIMPLPACPKYDQLLKICPIRRTGSTVEVPLSMEKMEFSFCSLVPLLIICKISVVVVD